MQTAEPQLLITILKHIMTDLKSSPVIREVALIFKSEIKSCQELYERKRELSGANNQLNEAQLELNMEKQTDLIFQTCPFLCASLAGCLVSSNHLMCNGYIYSQ